ncbi:LytR/AlgR family response regulator transcription factor [Desertimonas flava]|uniref:LytR/AlgR family response regulator transcription factor n=1 Tax=Desertimonas flava TaxID=2064846 RepID=UPI000E34AF78|nr:LytTR family DNA-binding domain-containing protein [Desertimonas flava]
MVDEPRHRCLIVDDEAPARGELRHLLGEIDDVQVVGEAANAAEALQLIRSLTYDVVLLDVRMPGGSGLDIAAELQTLAHPPKVIFTTAYPDHAVEAFDLAAVDYLLKPFDSARLARAISRALGSGHDIAHDAGPPIAGSGSTTVARIPVQRGERTVLVDESAIVYASASRGYSYLQLADERVLVSFSLNELERRLHGGFFRVHRSYLVNLDHVRELVSDFKGGLNLVMGDHRHSRVEVARRQARELRSILGVRGPGR